MNWAERNFSNLFAPKNQSTQAVTINDPQNQFMGEWLYRFYPFTDSYIAIKSTGDVLVLNKTLRPEPFVVGTLEQLILQVPIEVEGGDPEISDIKTCVTINRPKVDYIAEYKTTGNINALVILNHAPLLIPASQNKGLLSIHWFKSDLSEQQYRLKYINSTSEKIITEWDVEEQFEVIDGFRYRMSLTEISRIAENNVSYTPSLKVEPIATYCDNQSWSSNSVSEQVNGVDNIINPIVLNGQVNGLNEQLTFENSTYNTIKITVINQEQQKTIRWIDINTGTDAQREVYDSNNRLIFSMQRRD